MESHVRRSRASKPKVRTGCITCKIRRVKCDERKPACDRYVYDSLNYFHFKLNGSSCLSTGRKCDGYAQQQSPTLKTPRELRLGATTITIEESRALEFFFHTTSDSLAGFLEGAFWKRSVLQLSLSEPAIRQALAALGSLHEYEGFRPASGCRTSTPAIADQLYSRAIRSTREKAGTGETAIPIVVMASILFTCVEFLRRNSSAASIHIASGLKILRTWRQSTSAKTQQLWGKGYSSYEAQFMETELAPILTLFNLNVSEFGPFPRNRLILNAVRGCGPQLPERFETLREVRVGLVDLVTASIELFQTLDGEVERGDSPSDAVLSAATDLQISFEHWKRNFDDLLQRAKSAWSKQEVSAATVIKIMQLGSEMGLAAYLVSNECEWDNYRAEYEEIIRLAEALVTDSDHYPNELSKALSLDLGLIYPLHAVAWKCRYPDIRRKGLDLLLQTARREWLLDARQYHAIFSRIMAIEENYLGLPGQNMLPPEHVRVHDFFCHPQEVAPGDAPRYSATFLTKPYGPEGPWHLATEYIHLPTIGTGDIAPSNLISPRRWANPDTTDPQTANKLKTSVFGQLGARVP
ncbi:hypothetical protein BDW75DRAFT_118163 [Aspergillus navahoensis]